MGGPGEDGQLTIDFTPLNISSTTYGRVVSVVLSGALVVGCTSSPSFNRAAAIDSFAEANSEATDEQAACVVDGLIERLGLEELEAELARQPIDAGFEETQFRQMFRCGVAGDWRSQITDQLVENGVGEADAPCVSEELFATMTDEDIDVLLSGETTDAFNERFFAALESCDALNP